MLFEMFISHGSTVMRWYKTSLLKALCGRSFYGESTGKIYINGHGAQIDDRKGVIGFVPQDDIVFAELTVKECLMYSGRFNAPKGTSLRYAASGVRFVRNFLYQYPTI